MCTYFELKAEELIADPANNKEYRRRYLSEDKSNEICNYLKQTGVWNLVLGYTGIGTPMAFTIPWEGTHRDIIRITSDLSEKFQDVLFIIRVYEEIKNDWIAYIINGYVQIAEAVITFRPFDREKMEMENGNKREVL